ncbi:hypothetical protein HNQ93_003615 [Hymenobacter luteus]|uniref:Uncharacterized protein n=2 Tax=Hymenobacter TaxID=89966 RepID=A0A7W9WDN6_9BACT|nr:MULTISPECIES: hypothetical protein [Hymenobacter]MBB4602848.1 hypothetical protein [Hymenobacter latericoloratus]MBB6060740.1 hypothetical protein [Hymenobacter luteus]
MKKVGWLILFAAANSCNRYPRIINERGILVLDQSRNCTSSDYFIPCEINDTIPLGKTVSQIDAHIARSVNPNQFQFAIMRTSWESAADSFYVKRKDFRKQYISAAELTLEWDYDTPEATIDSIRIAGSILINRLYPGRYRITSIKQIILPE